MVAAVAAVPLLVAGLRGLATSWTPVSDQAIEALRMYDVGSRHTPLLGAYSRLGWRHPGPLLFWVGAPFLRLFGPSGLLLGIATINLAGLMGALAAARRLGGALLVVPVAATSAVMMLTLGPVRLVDPWNPHVTYLPLLCFLLCSAAAAEGGARWPLPAAVVSGSFVAQSHLGAAAPVAAGAVGAAAWWWSARPEKAALPRPWRTGLVVLGLWSGPLVDQVAGRHNLTDLGTYFLKDDGVRPSVRDALGAAAREFGFRPAWTGGPELAPFDQVDAAPIWTLGLTAALLLAAWAVARRAGDGVARRLVLYVGWLGFASVAAITRTTDGLLAYVLRWTWPVAALGTACVVFVAARALALRPVTSDPTSSRARGGAAALVAMGAAVTAVVALAATVNVARTDLRPDARNSEAAGVLSQGVRDRVPVGLYGLAWQDPVPFAGVPQSVGMELVRHGYDVVFPSSEAYAVDVHRTGTAPDRPTLVVIGGNRRASWEAPDGARRIAAYRPLSSAQQRRRAQLEASVRAEASRPAGPINAGPLLAPALVDDGADPSEVRRLGELQLETAYDVWLVPPVAQN